MLKIRICSVIGILFGFVVVLMGQANADQQITKSEQVLGVCKVVNLNEGGQVNVDPMTLANAYFRTHDAKINHGTA